MKLIYSQNVSSTYVPASEAMPANFNATSPGLSFGLPYGYALQQMLNQHVLPLLLHKSHPAAPAFMAGQSTNGTFSYALHTHPSTLAPGQTHYGLFTTAMPAPLPEATALVA